MKQGFNTPWSEMMWSQDVQNMDTIIFWRKHWINSWKSCIQIPAMPLTGSWRWLTNYRSVRTLTIEHKQEEQGFFPGAGFVLPQPFIYIILTVLYKGLTISPFSSSTLVITTQILLVIFLYFVPEDTNRRVSRMTFILWNFIPRLME